MVNTGVNLFFPDMSKIDYDYALVIENATKKMLNDNVKLFEYFKNECTYMTVEKLEAYRNEKLNESQRIL